MTEFGINAEGFRVKTLRDVLAQLETDCRGDIHPQIDLSSTEIVGQYNGIMSREFALIWELMRIVHDSRNRNNAEGMLLDNLVILTGSERDAEKKSKVLCTVSLADGTQLVPGEDFISREDRSDIRFTPVTEFTADADDDFEIEFESEFAGPVSAPGGTLTVIATPKTGWTAVTNGEDAILGALVEEDTALRLKADDELAAPGSNTPITLKADLLQVEGVIAATILENTSAVEVDGLPASSFEAIIDDNDTDTPEQNALIGAVVWAGRPTGTQPFGDEEVEILDLNGDPQTVFFSRADGVDVYLAFVLVKGQNYAGDAAFKEYVSNQANATQDLGEDARYEVIKSFARDVAGVIDWTMTIGTAPAPTGEANLAIGPRERARFSVARISIA